MHTKLPTKSGYFAKYIAFGGLIALFTVPLLANILGNYFEGSVTSGIIASLFLLILVPVLTHDIIRVLRYKERTKNRSERIASTFSDMRYVDGGSMMLSTPMFDALGSGDGGKSTFQCHGDGWAFMDYAFNKVTQTKSGSYLSSRYYFSVVQIQLPRVLPHMVFDSKQVKGGQMRFKFDRDQRLSLEGDFDKYFDTYFPAHYHIDTLSIITPTIMEALVAAHSFDIEIQGRTLNLYAPYLTPEAVRNMLNRGFTIRDKLMTNIDTYSDKRLAEASRENIHVAGLTIQKNFIRDGISLLAYGILMGALSLASLPRIEPTIIETLWDISFQFVFLVVISVFLIMGGVAVLKKGYTERARRLDANRPTNP